MALASYRYPAFARAAGLLAIAARLLPVLAACGSTREEPSNTVQPVPATQYQHPEL